MFSPLSLVSLYIGLLALLLISSAYSNVSGCYNISSSRIIQLVLDGIVLDAANTKREYPKYLVSLIS